MPGLQHPFPIDTNEPHTAMLLIAWEMTKLNLHHRTEKYTDDDVREEYVKNYTALRLANAATYVG